MTVICIDQETERSADAALLAERILVVAPTADDAALASAILEDTGLIVLAVTDLAAIARELDAGAGAVVIASEALADDEGCASLRQALERQEPWSEIPILIIGAPEDAGAGRIADLLGGSAHMVLLERPLGLAAFLTATDAALRSRRRQYEVRRLFDELAQSAVALERAHEEANQTKDEFLATLAHELRSPLTSIRGWIQMLREGDLSSSDAQEALTMIEASTRVQSHIVEDLMDVSRILAGKIMIDPSMTDLSASLTSVVGTFRPAAALQGVHVSAVLPAEEVKVWGDETRLQQIGWNLLSNAIKFTPRGGSVQVSLATSEDSAVVRVTDTGRGIAPELLPHVFDRYRQAEDEGASKHNGLGLGLAIVRHLVESHGGTIEAFSDGLGKGAEFVVTLPLRAATVDGS